MKCKNCGTEMLVDTSVVYTTNPPMYKWKCPKCGCEEYHLTSEYENNTNTQQGKIIVKDEWSNFRCIAAKDFLAASIQHSGFCGNPKDDNHISRAIQYADELIEQLKERDEHNNSK